MTTELLDFAGRLRLLLVSAENGREAVYDGECHHDKKKRAKDDRHIRLGASPSRFF